MIYDVHTHIGLDPGFYYRGWWPYAATTMDLLEQMDRWGVDKAVCFPFVVSEAYDVRGFIDRGEVVLRPGAVPYAQENARLIREVRHIDTEKKLRVLAMFDPGRAVEQQLAQLRGHVPRLTGLKLQGTVIQSRVAHLLDDAAGIMHLAEEHDLPVLIHTSILPADVWSQAADCLDVAEKYPKVRFNLAHSLRFSLSNLKRAAGLGNVWIDCSAHLAHCALAVMESPGVAAKDDRVDADYSRPCEVLEAVAGVLRKDQYMWGSDNPYQSWCDDSLKLVFRYKQEVEVLNGLPADLRKSMGEVGPLAWLGARERVTP